MVRDISATVHRDFSVQVDRLHRIPLAWLITGGLALMIATTGRLAAKFKLRMLDSAQFVVEKCRRVDIASIDKMRALLAYLWGRRSRY